MKLRWLVILGVTLLAAQCAKEPTDLKTEKDKVDYSIGVNLARNFQQQDLEVNLDLVIKGMRDKYSGKKLLLSEDEMRTTMMAFQQEMRLKQMRARNQAKIDNKKEGDAFLAENKKREGVVALPNGLQYKVLKAGEGKKPGEDNTVEVRYRGTLINGKEFDSSGNNSKTFKLSQVIPGLREGLKLMPLNSKYQLVIPPELAYGEQGAGQVIPPNSTLIFEVELLDIK